MPIDHTFVSPVADEGDPDKVGPDEWNAAHTLPTHAETTGQTANDHHNQDHASRHANGGADELEVEDLATADLTTSHVLRPDGAGGVAFAAPAAAASHNLLDGSVDQDTLAGSVVDGDVIIGNVTPKWSRLGISIPGGAGLLNVLGIITGELRASWKALFDATAPVTQAYGDTADAGTVTVAARRDHKHGMPAAGSERAASSTTPSAVGTAAVGTGVTDARGDHVHPTGAGTPSTQALGDAAATGTGPAAAMTDHKHAMMDKGASFAYGADTTHVVNRPQLHNYDADTPPASPNAMDDEFDDTSGMSGTVNSLNARWTWRNQSTSSLAYTKAGFLSMTIPASATDALRIIEQTLPAGTAWDFACKVSVEGQSTNHVQVGMTAFDGTNARLFTLHLHLRTLAAGTSIGIESSFWNSVTSFNVDKFTEFTYGPSMVYLRMVRSGNDILQYYSSDGVCWARIGTFTDATNVPNLTTIGLFCSETNNLGLTKGHFDWFRRLA